MKAALLDKNNRVIGEVFDAPEQGHTISIAGAFAADGTPINVKAYRISRSKKNLAMAVHMPPAYKKGNVWIFD